MKQIAQNSTARPRLDDFSIMHDSVLTYIRIPIQRQSQEPPQTIPEAIRPLEKIKESLVNAYLAANMNFSNLPLKTFMDSFEKNILLTCLHLTGGNQKNAAAIIGIKPTLLFEKMRKHGIGRKQLRLPGALPPRFGIQGE